MLNGQYQDVTIEIPDIDSDIWSNAGLVLAHRLRHWANTKPALDEHLAFADEASCQKTEAIGLLWAYNSNHEATLAQDKTNF